MATGEGIPEEFDFGLLEKEFGGDNHENGSLEPTLKNIFYKHCSILVDEGLEVPDVFWADDLRCSVETKDQGNNLVIYLDSTEMQKESVVRIGHYWAGNYTIYPELLDDTNPQNLSYELQQIQLQALAKKASYIERCRDMRLDYGQPSIQELHRDLSSHLSVDSVNEILARYCDLCESEREKDEISDIKKMTSYSYSGPQLLADEYTSAAICLRSDPQKGERYLEDNILSIKVTGAYIETPSGFKSRRPNPIFIDLARRHPITYTDESLEPVKGVDWDEPDFEDSFNIIDSLVPGFDLDEYVELAQKIRDLAADFSGAGLNFDKKQLGVLLPPPPIHERQY